VESRVSILFDLDGTLCDPRKGIIGCLRYSLDQLGYSSPPDDQLERYIGPPLYDSFATLLGSNDSQLIEKAVGLYRQRFTSNGMYENKVYAGIPDTLATLQSRNYRLHVVTSKPTVFAARVVVHFGLQRLFRNIYGSELDGSRSDKGELIAHVLSEEKILASDAIMVGDREHDIKGALANGVFPIGVLWGYGTREELTGADAALLCESPEALVYSLCSRSLLKPVAPRISDRKEGQP
jgi:phosphoglycolate phosphatase